MWSKGLWFRVSVVEWRVRGVGLRAYDSGFRARGSWVWLRAFVPEGMFVASGLGFRLRGLGFRV